MKIFPGPRTQPPHPTPPVAPRAPSAPRPSSGRPGSQRSVGSAGRFSTSSQSTPEPDADIGEDDCAVYSGDEAPLDAGWGVVQDTFSKRSDESSSRQAAALAAAENRIRSLEKQIQVERRMRKDAEDSLSSTRSKLTTPVQSSRCASTHSEPDNDLLMDVGVQTDKQPLPGRQEVEQEIETAVARLQKRNDTLEIENQMLQAEIAEKYSQIATLQSDNKILWEEQDVVRAAKEDFKDLQKQLASHVKAGHLITKRPSSAANRFALVAQSQEMGNSDPFGGFLGEEHSAQAPSTMYAKERRTELSGDIVAHNSLSELSSPGSSPTHSNIYHSEQDDANDPQTPVRQVGTKFENESALSNFMGIFQGSIHDGRDTFEDDDDDAGYAGDFTSMLASSKIMSLDRREKSRTSVNSQKSVASENSATSEKSKPSVAEYRRSVGDYRSGIALLEAKLRPASAARETGTTQSERPVTAETSKPSVAEYRRSVGDYRSGIAALEAKLRPATNVSAAGVGTVRSRTHNTTSLHVSQQAASDSDEY